MFHVLQVLSYGVYASSSPLLVLLFLLLSLLARPCLCLASPDADKRTGTQGVEEEAQRQKIGKEERETPEERAGRDRKDKRAGQEE